MGVLRLTNDGLARKTGLSRQTIGLIKDGKAENPELSSLSAIAIAIGLELVDLFEPLPVATRETDEKEKPPAGEAPLVEARIG